MNGKHVYVCVHTHTQASTRTAFFLFLPLALRRPSPEAAPVLATVVTVAPVEILETLIDNPSL